MSDRRVILLLSIGLLVSAGVAVYAGADLNSARRDLAVAQDEAKASKELAKACAGTQRVDAAFDRDCRKELAQVRQVTARNLRDSEDHLDECNRHLGELIVRKCEPCELAWYRAKGSYKPQFMTGPAPIACPQGNTVWVNPVHDVGEWAFICVPKGE